MNGKAFIGPRQEIRLGNVMAREIKKDLSNAVSCALSAMERLPDGRWALQWILEELAETVDSLSASNLADINEATGNRNGHGQTFRALWRATKRDHSDLGRL